MYLCIYIYICIEEDFITTMAKSFCSLLVHLDSQAAVDETLEAMQHKLDGQRWGCQEQVVVLILVAVYEKPIKREMDT